MTDPTTPRIYVASLSDYNGGKLHGVWIDATLEPDAIYEQVQAMLKESPEFKEFPQGGPAEEWAIHDHEGFGSYSLGENEQFEKVSEIAQAIEEHGDALTGWLELSSDNEVSDFEAHYRGQWDSEQDFAQATVQEIGWSNVSAQLYTSQYSDDTINVFDELSSYLDWESIARELFQHGNYSSHSVGPIIHVYEDEV